MKTATGFSPEDRDPREDEDVILDFDDGDPTPPHLLPRPKSVRWDTEAHLTMAMQHVAHVPEEQVPQLRETPRIRQWEAEARKEGVLTTARKGLLRVLAVRLQTPVPDDVVAQVAAASDAELLERWFEGGLQANSYEEFRLLTQTTPPPGS